MFAYFDSVRRLGFYFDCVKMAIGWRGHLTQHMTGSTVRNQNKYGSPESEINTYRVA